MKRFVYRYWQHLHAIRKIELSRLAAFLRAGRQGNGEAILDLGCGKGFLCGVLHEAGYRVFGIDPLQSEIDIAKRYMPGGISFLVGRGESLPYEDGTFDKVVSVSVLEHTRDDIAVLREVSRVLRVGGIFAFSADSMNSRFIGEAFRVHHVREYQINHLYDLDKIRSRLEEAGFQMAEFEYLFDSPLSIGIMRFSSRFHYRGLFFLLFPVLYPLLWLDDRLSGKRSGGAILVVRAIKKRRETS